MPTIVGIAGGTASGKSTLARAVAEATGALHILHDRYYFTLPEAFRERPSTYNFDHPVALDTERLIENLASLRAGQSASLPVYDFKTHTRAPELEEVAPHPIVLVEGILAFSEPRLCELMDLQLFVDAPADIRLMRRIRRDLQKRGRTIEAVLEQYERTVRPMHEAFVAPTQAGADLVLDGTEPPEELLRVALERIAAVSA